QRQIQALNVSHEVVMTGRLNQDQVLARCQTVDAFAMASFAEGIPVVLMEAMAMEIPCVSTWVNGIPELIENGVNGLLVPPSNVEEFTAAMRRMIEEPELRERLGRAARRTVLEHYDLMRNVDQLDGIFRRYLR